MAKKYAVSDGKLTLQIEEIEDGWLLVRSPTDPAMITQARTIKEAFTMARDAFAALADSRSDSARWKATTKARSRAAAPAA
ncbi:MAG: type II toxin-antitoxin system HicB family antitoxin [Burkholderiales bacterium]|nr:type II toxin-antitoxin system HicB family antitoxin [Phycisphaerae bacterium]